LSWHHPIYKQINKTAETPNNLEFPFLFFSLSPRGTAEERERKREMVPDGAMLWLGLLLCAVVCQTLAAGNAVCHCNCCEQLLGQCTDPATTSFCKYSTPQTGISHATPLSAVGDCSHCTKEACWDHFRECKDSVVIESSCLGTSSSPDASVRWHDMCVLHQKAVKPEFTLVVILFLLCGVTILLVISVLRYYTPFIQHLFPCTSPHPYPYYLPNPSKITNLYPHSLRMYVWCDSPITLVCGRERGKSSFLG